MHIICIECVYVCICIVCVCIYGYMHIHVCMHFFFLSHFSSGGETKSQIFLPNLRQRTKDLSKAI